MTFNSFKAASLNTVNPRYKDSIFPKNGKMNLLLCRILNEQIDM